MSEPRIQTLATALKNYGQWIDDPNLPPGIRARYEGNYKTILDQNPDHFHPQRRWFRQYMSEKRAWGWANPDDE